MEVGDWFNLIQSKIHGKYMRPTSTCFFLLKLTLIWPVATRHILKSFNNRRIISGVRSKSELVNFIPEDWSSVPHLKYWNFLCKKSSWERDVKNVKMTDKRSLLFELYSCHFHSFNSFLSRSFESWISLFAVVPYSSLWNKFIPSPIQSNNYAVFRC